MTRLRLSLVAVGCVALTACSGSSPRTAAPQAARTTAVPTTPVAAPPASTPTSPTTSPAARTPSPTAAAATPLDVRTVRSTGRVGRTAWTAELPVFRGAATVAAAATERARRSAEEEVARLAREAPQDVDTTVDVTSRVTVNDGRTVQVQLGYEAYAQRSAHPSDEVTTVVLRRADAAPVLLTGVFTTTGPPLAAALRHGTQVAAASGQDDPAQSLTTREADWADWQAGPQGLTFFFDDYRAGSHAAGLRRLDVPWSLVRPWVRPEAYALLGPR